MGKRIIGLFLESYKEILKFIMYCAAVSCILLLWNLVHVILIKSNIEMIDYYAKRAMDEFFVTIIFIIFYYIIKGISVLLETKYGKD